MSHDHAEVPVGSDPYEPARARPGAPNVVVIALDDTGFAQFGAFGGDLDTPHLDRLAAGGLRYRTFHVTALCSPTRAALLTGRNHHAVGMGFLADLPTSDPGYGARLPRTAAALPRVLRDAGYSTMAVGKWHLVPGTEKSAVGPFDRWPLGVGFERYYGFLGGDTNCWAPNLVCDNHRIDPPAGPDDGYHLHEDLADQAIRMVQDQKQTAPEKPFFLYWAPVATHAPHHVAPEWIEPYEGRYDDGWDRYRERAFARQLDEGVVPEHTRLTERPPWVEAWDDLDDDARRLFSRMHEVYGGFMTHNDAQIGRFLEFLERIGQFENTIVMVVSDNGASAEGGPLGTWNEHRFSNGVPETVEGLLRYIDDLGGPRTYPHYAWGWAWAGNTPFRLWKRYTWLGGTRTPLIVHWPAGIRAAGEVRSQFCHVIDVMPTLLEVCGVEAPDRVDGIDQQPVHGASLVPTFEDADAPDTHRTQYFEMLGSRSMVHDGWKATTDHIGQGVVAERELIGWSHEFETDRWSLFDLRADPSESTDVAEAHPERLAELVELWDEAAERYGIHPMSDSLTARIAAMTPPPYPSPDEVVYRPGGSAVADSAMPLTFAGYELEAHVEAGGEGPHGVVVAVGDWTGGFALYGIEGRLVFAVNLVGEEFRVTSPAPLGEGPMVVTARHRPTGPATGELELAVDGQALARAEATMGIPVTWQHGGTGLRIGEDLGLPVTDDYRPPFRWRGSVDRVVLRGAGALDRPARDAAARAAMHAD